MEDGVYWLPQISTHICLCIGCVRIRQAQLVIKLLVVNMHVLLGIDDLTTLLWMLHVTGR